MDWRSLKRIIKADLYRYDGLTGYRGILRGLLTPGFRYLFLFRLVTSLGKSPVRFILKIVKRRYRYKYGFEIDFDADIGEGFYLSEHCGSVVIGPIKIGKHCNVAHVVTIGRS